MEEATLRAGLSGVIRAGGKSRRMGRDKSQLVLGGEMLIARAVRTLHALSDDVLVVTNSQAGYPILDARFIFDLIPNGGALAGIHAGLVASHNDQAFVVACDMPFLNLALLRHMASLAPGYDAVVPHWHDELEPLHAIYSRACAPVIESLLAAGVRRIVDLYPLVKTYMLEAAEILTFDPDGLSFFNVNSPEDWAHAQELAARETRP